MVVASIVSLVTIRTGHTTDGFHHGDSLVDRTSNWAKYCRTFHRQSLANSCTCFFEFQRYFNSDYGLFRL